MVEIPPLVHVTGVEVIGDHELRLSFGKLRQGATGLTDRIHPLHDLARQSGSIAF
jgi:hypothetical protein